MRCSAFLAAALAPAVLAAPAAAAEDPPARTLTVVNDTSAAVNQLFVAGGKRGGLKAKVAGVLGGGGDNERDRLDAKMLPRGGTLMLELRGDRCRYDLRAVLEDGRTFTADDFDVCASPRWAIGSGQRR